MPSSADVEHDQGAQKGGEAHAIVNVRVIEGVFDGVQKREIVERLTDAIVAVYGENTRPVTWVLIEEPKGGDWGIGGDLVTADAVRAVTAGTPA